jgi:cell division protein ZapA (FtsZ GTPase activity inhibitor)
MTAQTTNFDGRAPAPDELQDLILLDLAIRDQARLDERRRPAPARLSGEHGLNIREIVAHEGWQVSPSEVDHAVQQLTLRQLVSTDHDPLRPGVDGCRTKLRPDGLAEAAAVARRYLGEPLRSFQLDDEMFEGIGQIEVEFLGDRFVLGCVEGEEDRAIRLAHRLEVDAGEVLKAITGDLDHTRTMLMAGILAHERIDELENGTEFVPASDRVVRLDHNVPAYAEAMVALDALILVVRESNSYREMDEADQERRVAELEAGRTLLGSRWVSLKMVKATLWSALAYLALKFADAPIGEAATLAWNALKRLLRIE